MITKQRINLILNILIVILLLAIAIYGYIHIEEIRLLGTDPCKYCMEKTGALCYKFP